ncbi:MAG: helix-turn-helix transcriptional regulator [Saprospiraceae bacterium]|nr:helix-turn-helix transcriptional regulator [Saprospiraceae bacterium]
MLSEYCYSKNELKDYIFKLCEYIDEPQLKNRDLSGMDTYKISKIDYGLPIKDLAKKAHLSKFHFQRKFKKKCGLTIGQLKQQEKTIMAKRLLENGKLSSDVAYELGFFDQSHFIKYFKKCGPLHQRIYRRAFFYYFWVTTFYTFVLYFLIYNITYHLFKAINEFVSPYEKKIGFIFQTLKT